MGVSPLAEGGLDEAFSLAIGLGGIGFGEAMPETEGGHGRAHGVGPVAGAIVGEDPLGLDAVAGEEAKGGVEESDGAAGGLIGEDLSESETGVIIDGDVEELPAGARGVIVLTVAGNAMARAHDAGELLDIEVDEFAGPSALGAADRERRLQGREPGRMLAQEA